MKYAIVHYQTDIVLSVVECDEEVANLLMIGKHRKVPIDRDVEVGYPLAGKPDEVPMHTCDEAVEGEEPKGVFARVASLLTGRRH